MKSFASLDPFPSRKDRITQQVLTKFSLLQRETSVKKKDLPVEVVLV